MSSRQSTRKSLSKIPTPGEYKAFSKAHQNVLLEQIDKSVRAIAEGHTVLHETMEKNHVEITTRLDRVEDHLEHVEVRLEKVEGRLEKVEGRLDKVEGRLDKVENRLEHVEVVVVEILERLKSLAARIAVLEAERESLASHDPLSQDPEERFRQLEQRVAVLEAHSS